MNRKINENNENYTFELVFQEDRNIFSVNKSLKEYKKNIKDNLLTSSIIISSGTIGVGVLYMWSQLYLSGLVLGSIQIIFSALITYLSSLAWILAAQKVRNYSYTGVAEETMGKYKIIIDIMFFIANLGSTIALKFQMNLILLESFSFFNSYFNLNMHENFFKTKASSFIMITIMNIILFGFFFLKTIEPLKLFNYIGIFSVLLIVFILIFLFIDPSFINYEIPTIKYESLKFFNFDNFFKTLPYFIGSFCIHPFILDVYKEIRPNTNNNFKKVLRMSLLKISLIYLSCSIFGYLIFFQNPIPFDDVLKKFKSNNLIINLPNFIFFLSLFGSCVIMNKTVKDQIISKLSKSMNKKKNIVYSIAAIITIIQTILLLVIIIYKIEPSLILNYLSLITNTPISIVFPFVFFVISHKNEAGGFFRTKFIKYHTLLIILGTIIYSLLIIHILDK